MSDKPKKKQLSLKEQKFVHEYVANGGVGAEAARVAYPTSKNPTVIAAQVKQRPHVQESIQEKLDRLLPNYEEKIAELMQNTIAEALASTDLRAKTAALEAVTRISGMQAPKETHTKTLKASIKLPGSKE
jgi:phage terminase small subunit